MTDKEKIMVLLDELYDDIQDLREEGETDLRMVLHLIYKTKMKIAKS